MKKFTFTVAQLLLLHEVRASNGFSSQRILQFLDDAEHDESKSTIELSDKEVADIADSIQSHIDGTELSEEELEIANSILVLLGVLEKEVAEESADQTDITDEDDEYSPNPD